MSDIIFNNELRLNLSEISAVLFIISFECERIFHCSPFLFDNWLNLIQNLFLKPENISWKGPSYASTIRLAIAPLNKIFKREIIKIQEGNYKYSRGKL